MEFSKHPKAIEIQTVAACNARCVICPHPEASQELPRGVMPEDLFKKIIDEIEPVWRTRIIPYLNSEPFLDSKFSSHLQYILRKDSGAQIEVSTNVSLLSLQRQKELEGIKIHELRLSVFGFTEQTHRAIMPGLKWTVVRENLEYLVCNRNLRSSISRMGIVMIRHPLVTERDICEAQAFCQGHSLEFHLWGFLDRAGNVAQYSNEVYRTVVHGCEQKRPLERMHITHTGDVIICCQDWRWKNVLGNVRDQSLSEVWNSERYQEYRLSIYGGTKAAPEICKKCKLSY